MNVTSDASMATLPAEVSATSEKSLRIRCTASVHMSPARSMIVVSFTSMAHVIVTLAGGSSCADAHIVVSAGT